MDESHEVRRSGRRRVRPVEFWNFEKPENSTCEAIIYNEIELTKCSIFKPFSLSYCRGSPANYTGIGGKEKSPPGKAAKKTVPTAHSSKRSARKTEVSTAHNGETVTPNKLTDNSAHSSKNSACSPKPRGQKRKLEYSEKAEACPVVNGEDQSLSPKFRRRKGSISGQKSPRKARNQSLPDERDSLHSPRMSRKKQKLEAREQSGDETRSPRKAAGFSPRITRRRSGSGGLNKQKAESGKAGVKTYESNTNNNNNNNINNRLADVSATPLKNQSNFRGSFFNDSNRQHSRSNLTGKDTTQNTTAFEQPSFRNILSSTAIEAPKKAVFKVPRLPSRKHMVSSMKLSSHCVDPSMVTIPEEEEQDEQCEKQRGEEQEQMEVEKEPQSQDREDGEGDATATATATATASTASPRKHARSEKSHTARVATAPEGHEQGKDHQGQEDTTQGAGNTRRSSRVRTKPLEFWNFEKVQVERQEDGEVKVIHHKQDSTMQIQTRVIDCSAVVGSQVGRGITLPEDLLRVEESTVTSNKPSKSSKTFSKAGSSVAVHPALSPKQIKKVNAKKVLSSWSPNPSPSKSPSKRRLFSPNLNYFDEPAEEESRISRISVGGKKLTVVGRVKFNDLPFIVLEKKAYRCCVAHGMHNKEKTIFISYLFLERGNIVWNSSGKMTIYVIDGLGTMQVMSEGGAVCHQLKAKHTVQCPKESKISVRKDGRCKMLRLHVCLVRGPAMPGTC